MKNSPIPAKPKQGQVSVWDFPRPPALVPTNATIEVIFNRVTIVRTNQAYKVLETSHPPGYYIPPLDIDRKYLIPSDRITYCEWKGEGSYYHIKVGDQQVDNAAWYYNKPKKLFSKIKGYISIYPKLMDACMVNGEKAMPQPGDFYGGWVTQDVCGPFKGMPESSGW